MREQFLNDLEWVQDSPYEIEFDTEFNENDLEMFDCLEELFEMTVK